ncbi:MAG: hypothetical protein ACOCTI_00895 [Phycisphaeraceae bacterium]
METQTAGPQASSHEAQGRRTVHRVLALNSAMASVAGVVALVGAAVMHLFLLPRMVDALVRYEIEVPGLTAVLIALPPLLHAGAAGLISTLLVVKEIALYRRPAVNLMTSVAVSLLAIGWLALVALALSLPVRELSAIG